MKKATNYLNSLHTCTKINLVLTYILLILLFAAIGLTSVSVLLVVIPLCLASISATVKYVNAVINKI